MQARSDLVRIHADPGVLRAVRELARILGDIQTLDDGGAHLVAVDEVRNRMQREGGCLDRETATAIQKAIDNNWLVHGTVQLSKRIENAHTGVAEAHPRLVDVAAIAPTPEFLVAARSGRFDEREHEIILLVHGIRTFAFWQPMVKGVLEEIPNVEVRPVQYNFLDPLFFWFPGPFRWWRIRQVRREIHKADLSLRDRYGSGQLSVIAHSFGTYIITSILLDHPGVRFHRLVLCGSIVDRDFRWDHVEPFLENIVINDYGLRDYWPVAAHFFGVGFGDTGRHKFGKAEVKDRAHNFNHTDYFEQKAKRGERFVRKYWKPWFENGKIVESPWDKRASSAEWVAFLSGWSIGWPLTLIVAIGLLIGVPRAASTLIVKIAALISGSNDPFAKVTAVPVLSARIDVDRLSDISYERAVMLSDAAFSSGNWALVQMALRKKEVTWTGHVVRRTRWGYIIRPNESGPRKPRHEATVTMFNAPDHLPYLEGAKIRVSGLVSSIDERGIEIVDAVLADD